MSHGSYNVYLPATRTVTITGASSGTPTTPAGTATFTSSSSTSVAWTPPSGQGILSGGICGVSFAGQIYNSYAITATSAGSADHSGGSKQRSTRVVHENWHDKGDRDIEWVQNQSVVDSVHNERGEADQCHDRQGGQLGSTKCVASRLPVFEILVALCESFRLGPAIQSRVRNYRSEEKASRPKFGGDDFAFIEWTGNPYGL